MTPSLRVPSLMQSRTCSETSCCGMNSRSPCRIVFMVFSYLNLSSNLRLLCNRFEIIGCVEHPIQRCGDFIHWWWHCVDIDGPRGWANHFQCLHFVPAIKR